jgi:uncharacterized membrane protein YkvA (DUF1232 family)
MGNKAKALLPILFAALYGASPIDVIPDILLLVGWLDDATMAGVMGMMSLWLFVRSLKRPNVEPPPLPARIR